MKRYLPFAIIAGVLIVALAGGAVLWRSSRQAETPTQPFTSPTPPPSTPARQATPGQTPATSGPDNAHARGALNSKVILEEYGDYQCPSCGGLYHELKILEKDYGEE